MKLYIQKTVNGSLEAIQVKDDPLGKGGQGAVYNIITSQYKDEYCIKIYLRDAQAVFEKIKYMVSHPPQNIKDNPSFRICWPVALVYNEQKKFVGYMMPLAFPRGNDLTIISVYRNKPLAQIKRFKNKTEWHNKYELDTQEGILNRIKMLCNVAIALHKIHDTGRYVLVDLKPENIDATGTGKVSIMDTDSIQISESGRILHPATAFTPDYFAPEGKNLQKCKRPFTVQCDYFAAAICFYQILTGTHPYTGVVLLPPLDKYTEISDCIAEGLFAHTDDKSKQRYMQMPTGFNPQQNFFNLPPEVQAMFKRAFGPDPKARPSMEEWGKVFYSIIKNGVKVASSSIKRNTSTGIPFKITNVTFADISPSGNITRSAGSPLYTDVAYLSPVVSYEVLNIAGNIELSYKIIDPRGNVKTSANAKDTIACTSKGKYTKNMSGWGNDKKTSYQTPGRYTIEFYFKNKCVYQTHFIINALGSRPVTPPPTQPVTPRTTSTSSGTPFKITNVTFTDTDKAGNTINDDGKVYNNTSYLTPKIYFDVATGMGKSVDLWIRITGPSGKVQTNSPIKSGFYNTTLIVSNSGSYTQIVAGWGNEDKTAYADIGAYRYEIYYQNSCIYSTTINVVKKSLSFGTTPKKKKTSRTNNNFWSTANGFISNIGYKLEDIAERVSDFDILAIILGIIGGLGIIGLAISTGSIFWGIVVGLICFGVGSWLLPFATIAVGFIISLVFRVFRYIFYNIFTFILTVVIVVGISCLPIIEQDLPMIKEKITSISKSKEKKPETVEPSTTKTTTYICISNDVLNIRSTPNTNGKVVATIIPQQTVEVYFIKDGWAKVNLNGQIGYASAKYLKKHK